LIWFVLFIWLNQTNQIDQTNQINQTDQQSFSAACKTAMQRFNHARRPQTALRVGRSLF